MKLRFLVSTLLAAQASAFVAPDALSSLRQLSTHRSQNVGLAMASGGKSLVVISPPGGVGEVTAVKAASTGSSVRWFVVSQQGGQNVVLSFISAWIRASSSG